MFGITRAPDFDHAKLAWFNLARPLSLADLRGRLVILDFWTFCCINCLHTLPTLRIIEDSHPTEVAVIGIHSPKFDHERDPKALASALERYGITHPVAHDPHSGLWNEYCIRAWPSLVFISPDGMIIGQLAGEPNPEVLLNGIGAMLEHFTTEGSLSPSPFPPQTTPLPVSNGALRFPGKIKPCPSADGRKLDGGKLWAIADSGHHQIVLVDDGGTEIRRWGSGQPGFTDGSDAAGFNGPEGLSCTEDAIYVADTRNHAIRRIDRASNAVTTIAGTGERGGGLRSGEAARTSALASPWDLDIPPDGGTLVFVNAGSHQIGRIDLAGGTMLSVTGSGDEGLLDGPASLAMLAQPSGVACLGATVYFVDAETSSVRTLALEDGTVRTLAGTGLFDFGHHDGPLAEASLQHPLGLAVLDGGRLAVADSYNGALRLIDLDAGRISSLKPTCTDTLCRPWSEPAGIAADGPARLLLSDTNNHRIVEIDLDQGTSRTWLE